MPRKYSEAQNKATQKYIQKAYDTITTRVPKGMRDVYKAHADRRGVSLNKLVTDLLDKDMEAFDNGGQTDI